MKGLIYKELLLKRKTLFIALLVWVLLFILAVSFCLSLDFGNLADNENFTAGNMVFFSYILAAVAMFSLIFNGDTVYRDAKCHWELFAYTLPVSAKKTAAVRILLLGASALFSLVISLSAAWMISALSHCAFDFTVFKNFVIMMLFCMLITVISTMLMFWYKTPQAVTVRLLAGFAVVYGAAVIWFFTEIKKAQERLNETAGEEITEYAFKKIADVCAGIRDTIFPFSVVIFAAIILSGYFLFTGQLERREN